MGFHVLERHQPYHEIAPYGGERRATSEYQGQNSFIHVDYGGQYSFAYGVGHSNSFHRNGDIQFHH